MKERCELSTSPRRSSVPVLMTMTVTLSVVTAHALTLQHFISNLVRACARPSRRFLLLLQTNNRRFLPFNHRAIDRHLGDVFATWNVVHDFEHDPFEHGTEGARASPFCHSLSRERLQSAL